MLLNNDSSKYLFTQEKELFKFRTSESNLSPSQARSTRRGAWVAGVRRGKRLRYSLWHGLTQHRILWNSLGRTCLQNATNKHYPPAHAGRETNLTTGPSWPNRNARVLSMISYVKLYIKKFFFPFFRTIRSDSSPQWLKWEDPHISMLFTLTY